MQRTVFSIETGEALAVEPIDAKELVESGGYSYDPLPATKGKPAPAERDILKARLGKLGVEFNPRASTEALQALLESAEKALEANTLLQKQERYAQLQEKGEECTEEEVAERDALGKELTPPDTVPGQ